MIAELLPGQMMNQIALVNSFERRQKKSGEEYLKLIVKDISGLMDVMVWDRSEKEINDLETNLKSNRFVYIEGQVEKFKFDNKDAVNVKAKVIYPVDGIRVTGEVIRKNKMGLYVNYQNAIHIQVPRDLHLGNETFDNVQVGDNVQVELKRSKFAVNDLYILSSFSFISRCGDYN